MSETVEEFIEYDFDEITQDQLGEGIEIIEEDVMENGTEIVEEYLPQDDECSTYLDDQTSVLEDVEEIDEANDFLIHDDDESTIEDAADLIEHQENHQTQEQEEYQIKELDVNQCNKTIRHNHHVGKIAKPLNAKNNKGPRKFLLFDMLIAEIVDYDPEDGAPIVEFSLSKFESDAKKLPVECGICPDVMPRNKLNEHLKTHWKPGTKRFNCIYCDENFVSRSYAAGHARRHMGIRPYVCTVCKLYYCTKQDLKVHEQRRHLTKEHICEHCGKTFAQNTTLRSHVMLVHEQKRRFECEHCGKKFLRNYTKVKHIQNVHYGKRSLYDCPFCDKRFKDTHKLADHRKKFHLINQSNFECRECGLEFTSIDFFDAHRRSLQCRQKYKKRHASQEENQDTQEQEREIQENQDDLQVGTSEIEMQLEDIARHQEVLNQDQEQHLMDDEQHQHELDEQSLHQLSEIVQEHELIQGHHEGHQIIEPQYVVEIPAGVHIQPGQQYVIAPDGSLKQEEDFLYEIAVDS